MITVAGKVILVTGAAQGLGREYSRYLAESGAKIVLSDIAPNVIEVASEIKSNGGKAISVITDVSREDSAREMVRASLDSYGRIDVLINNAAVFQSLVKKSFSEITSEEWDRVMAVNLKGAFLCCKAVFPQMKSQGGGKIINVSSGSFFSGVPFFAHYVASKGGIVGLTRSLARELGEYNITVNAIAPGYTVTEAGKRIQTDPEYGRSIVKRRSIKREELPADLNGTVLYLCSNASDFVTGQTILVNGGDVFH